MKVILEEDVAAISARLEASERLAHATRHLVARVRSDLHPIRPGPTLTATLEAVEEALAAFDITKANNPKETGHEG